MNEHYLHFIWNKKRLPFHQIKTTQQEPIEILDVGKYNTLESGPDFSMAKVRIDGLVWVGSVEFHVKSSDWYKHKHDRDTAYNNVILHVVYLHDSDVTINERTIPVVELKNHIDEEHYLNYKRINLENKKYFSCESLFNHKYHIEIEKMKISAIQNRLLSRTLESFLSHLNSESSILLKLAANAFGTAVNGQPFEHFINSYTLNEIKNIDEKKKNEILTEFYWKQKGLFSNPEKRLNQFIEFVKTFDFEFHFWELPASMIFLYFEQLFKKAKINSKFLLNNFLINCIVRFLFWKGKKSEKSELKKKAIRLLALIPKEANNITRKWEEIGVQSKNAYDSQALLEIYKQFCIKKECLNCNVGKKILGI